MTRRRAGFVGRAEADGGAATYQCRARGFGFAGDDGAVDRGGVVSVDVGDDLPAVCRESCRGIVAEPAADFAVDGDAVVVVNRDEFAEF